MKMDVTANRLLDVLKQEGRLYQLLLNVIEKESKAVVRSELDPLINAGKEKDSLLLKLQQLEEQRIQLVSNMAQAIGRSPLDCTLTVISRFVDEPLGVQLRQAGSDLSSLLNTLKAVNLRSKQLFEHSRRLLRSTINFFSKLTCAETVYYRTGNIRRTYQTGKCVNGEV